MTIKHHIILSATISLALIALIACQNKTQAPETKEQNKNASKVATVVEKSTKEAENIATEEIEKTKSQAKEAAASLEERNKEIEEILKEEEEKAKAKAKEAAEAKAKEAGNDVSEVVNEATNPETTTDQIQEKNLILNTDFADEFDSWYVKNRNQAEISLDKINGHNIVKITGNGGWSTLSQKINVVEGKSYKFVVELKCDDWSEDLAVSFAFTDVDKNTSYMGFPEIETGDWSESTKTIKCNKSGAAKVMIQYQNKANKGTVYIRRIEAIEL